MEISQRDIDRFYSKVEKKTDAECWNWTAGKDLHGYGQFSLRNRQTGAHRIAWMIANGPIPYGLLVMHSCDNSSCCNPNHLTLGTAKTNQRDCIARGRRKFMPRPKFNGTDNVVSVARARLGITQREFAKLIGVSSNTVSRWELGTRQIPEPTARLIERVAKDAEKEKTNAP